MLELDLLTRSIQWLELLTWLVLGHPFYSLAGLGIRIQKADWLTSKELFSAGKLVDSISLPSMMILNSKNK